MFRLFVIFITSIIFGCTEPQDISKVASNIGNNPPVVSTSALNGLLYVRARAEFDLTSESQNTTQIELVKKVYATTSCIDGQCVDFSDVTVTNSISTEFDLLSDSSLTRNSNNQNLTNLVKINLGTLFDNNLMSCGDKRCEFAAIRIYTTDNNGTILGPGLWSQVINKSVALTVSGGSSNSTLAELPYNPTDGLSLQVDMEPLAIVQNVINLMNGDFADASSSGSGYLLSADFTNAGEGSYQAHVVVEYDLIGPAIN
jgi:hypothetical protein